MKKLFIISMALFLLINSVGYTVYAHYCDDELKEASLLVNTNDSCCEEETEGVMPASDDNTNMSCCAEQDVLVKIKDHFVKSELTFSPIQLPVMYLSNSLLHESIVFSFISDNNLSKQVSFEPPRKPIPDLGLLYSVFRI